MALKRLKTVQTELVHKNPYWEYWRDRYSLPGGNVGEYHFVRTPGSVMVVPVTHDGKLVMVKQFRYLWKTESVEFPSGGVNAPSFLTAAKNELAEEAKLSARNWKLVGKFNPFNGVTDEKCNVYVASELSPAEKGNDPSEEFEVMKMSPSELRRRIEKMEIWDGMTLAAWCLAEKQVAKFTKGRQ